MSQSKTTGVSSPRATTLSDNSFILSTKSSFAVTPSGKTPVTSNKRKSNQCQSSNFGTISAIVFPQLIGFQQNSFVSNQVLGTLKIRNAACQIDVMMPCKAQPHLSLVRVYAGHVLVTVVVGQTYHVLSAAGKYRMMHNTFIH